MNLRPIITHIPLVASSDTRAFHGWVVRLCVRRAELRDKFSITCFGLKYDEDLIFYTTNTTGQFDGVWNRTGIRNVIFPDTVRGNQCWLHRCTGSFRAWTCADVI